MTLDQPVEGRTVAETAETLHQFEIRGLRHGVIMP
jgi:hypothetical protein